MFRKLYVVENIKHGTRCTNRKSKIKSNQRFEKNPDIVPLQTAFMSVHRI
jgi:hypothetical protein